MRQWMLQVQEGNYICPRRKEDLYLFANYLGFKLMVSSLRRYTQGERRIFIYVPTSELELWMGISSIAYCSTDPMIPYQGTIHQDSRIFAQWSQIISSNLVCIKADHTGQYIFHFQLKFAFSLESLASHHDLWFIYLSGIFECHFITQWQWQCSIFQGLGFNSRPGEAASSPHRGPGWIHRWWRHSHLLLPPPPYPWLIESV